MTKQPIDNKQVRNIIWWCRQSINVATQRAWVALLAVACLTGGAAAATAQDSVTPRGYIVIILDDIGYRQTDGEALLLPVEVTFSVLPDTPLGITLAESAHQQGRDIMLHLPMEAQSGALLGPAGLTTTMHPQAISQTTLAALQSLPYAIGVNNHMGSRLTEQWLPMMALMRTLRAQDKFFIDSRTTVSTVAEQAARNAGVPVAHRHVFLDNHISREYMQRQFNKLTKLALQQGVAVGIAHPHPQTVRFLRHALARLSPRAIGLMPVSELMKQQQAEPLARQRAKAPVVAPE